MLIVVIMRRVGDLNIWGPLEGERVDLGAAPGAAGQEAFPLKASGPRQSKGRVCAEGALPPVPGCWGVTVWLKHQFPLPFPPCPQHVFPVIPAEKTSGLLERLWGGLGPFTQPQPLVSEVPASLLLPGAGPGARLVEMLVLDVPYRHPTPISSYVLPHTVPILNIPNTTLNFGLVG